MLRELSADLSDNLAHARGVDRVALAARTVRSARLVLESVEGADVESVRSLLSAIEAAHRQVGS
jgi:hypothetical protein